MISSRFAAWVRKRLGVIEEVPDRRMIQTTAVGGAPLSAGVHGVDCRCLDCWAAWGRFYQPEQVGIPAHWRGFAPEAAA